MPEPAAKSSPAGSACTYWGDLLSACESMFLKMALKNSEPVEDENGVIIYASEGINLERIKSSTGEVEALIERITGQKKSVAVRPLSEKGRMSSVQGAFPEELLRNINFEIGTEER